MCVCVCVNQLEKNIATLVSEGSLYARINRPSDEVCFAKPKVREPHTHT
jgi:hypothetical protein